MPRNNQTGSRYSTQDASRLTEPLTSVRLRQQFQRGLQLATTGALAGAAIGIVLLVLQRAEIIAATAAPWMCLLVGTVLGGCVGLLWPTSWKSTADLVDQKYDLKDRVLTALDFLAGRQSATNDSLRSLQVADALEHVDRVDPSEVLPYRLPRLAIPAALAVLVMGVVAWTPSGEQDVAAAPSEALPVVLEQASILEETMLEDIEQLAKDYDEEDLEELVEELKEAVEELQAPEVDQRDALTKLSEMQQAVAEKLEQLDVEQIDAQLEQLAQALEAAEASQAASQALKSQQYEKAASELEKIEASTMSRKEKDAVKQNLAKLAKNLGNAKKGELSDAVSQMLDGLENKNDSKCKSGMCKAAGLCKKQSVRKKISECLNCQLNRLSECKGCCQGGKNGGNCVKKSDSSKDTWGTGASGNPTGEKETKIDSKRRDESVTGIAGDGPSERETTSAPEGKQDAARSYKDRYAEYKKQMEEVIDSEPLPLGHRQTVRAYFESIRPANSDVLE